jgi:1,4-alpha-glucan branching enzyme
VDSKDATIRIGWTGLRQQGERLMIKKRFLKNNVVKVEFVLPEEIAANTESAFVVGDFNDWSETATPMQKLKNGTFKATLNLEANREYQFRYLVNGSQWRNDGHADQYVQNPYSGDNSVINTTQTSGGV